jgi:hypothetical protein
MGKTYFFIFCLPFRGAPKRESGPALRSTFADRKPRRKNSWAQSTRDEPDEEPTRRLLWPIATISLMNTCLGRDIRSAGIV